RTVEILFAERLDDAQVEERLGVFRIELQRMREQLEGLVRLVRVVVADAKVGTEVGIARRQFHRRLIPLDRVVVLFRVEVEVRELSAWPWIRRFAVGDRLESLHLLLVEQRGTARRRVARR